MESKFPRLHNGSFSCPLSMKNFLKRTFKNFAKGAFLLWKKPAYLDDQLQVAFWSARQQNCQQGKQDCFFSHSPSTPVPLLFFNKFVFK